MVTLEGRVTLEDVAASEIFFSNFDFLGINDLSYWGRDKPFLLPPLPRTSNSFRQAPKIVLYKVTHLVHQEYRHFNILWL